MGHQRAIRLAWEAFLADGRLPAGMATHLAASWQRSKMHGVRVELTEAPLASAPEVFRHRAENAELLAIARPAIARSGVLLSDAASMVILTDAGGFILETAGDRHVIEGGRRNHLETGGRWDETAIGTNAIGTALATSAPIMIHAAEHFCQDVQRWSCAAMPLRHPIDGTLLGVVDISGPAASFNPQSLALAAAVGREIEESLGHRARVEHEILLRSYVAKRSIWLSNDIVVLDRRGALVHATEAAQRGFETGSPVFTETARLLVGRADPSEWEENWRRRFSQASLEIVRQDGVALGCLVVIHPVRERRSKVAGSRTVATLIEPGSRFERIAGNSAAIQVARQRARKLAASGLPILIEGETGVGKELFARAIAETSPAAGGPFVPVNCGGIARDLIASELFGYVKGAFTGADEKGRIGKIEQADGGVLCLDEIGEMAADLQSYLLRVLEDHVVYRIGSHEGRPVKIQLVSMTNRDLSAEVEAGRFRQDLFYRVAAARLRIPPLRERGDDILLLAERFAAAAATRLDRPAPRFDAAVLAAFTAYRWPGNVRELRNVVDAMVALSLSDDRLTEADLPPELLKAPDRVGPILSLPPKTGTVQGIALKAAERSAILAQVDACGGNLTLAARRLGIARSTLYVRLAEYGYPRMPGGA